MVFFSEDRPFTQNAWLKFRIIRPLYKCGRLLMLQNVRLYKFPDSPLFFNQATLRFANFAHLGDFMNTGDLRGRLQPCYNPVGQTPVQGAIRHLLFCGIGCVTTYVCAAV